MDMGGAGGNFVLSRAQVVRQPGDGSCLFHSMSYGLGNTNASSLRREIGKFIEVNGTLEICETPMKDWVKWDSNSSVQTYARRISRSGWGGGIEMAACSRMKKVCKLVEFDTTAESISISDSAGCFLCGFVDWTEIFEFAPFPRSHLRLMFMFMNAIAVDLATDESAASTALEQGRLFMCYTRVVSIMTPSCHRDD